MLMISGSRGSGKTFAALLYASKMAYPLVVRDERMVNYVRTLANVMNIPLTKAPITFKEYAKICKRESGDELEFGYVLDELQDFERSFSDVKLLNCQAYTCTLLESFFKNEK
ncbi:hypothetical protein ZYGNAAKF_CDS0157 [Enterococcus phage VRE9_2]